MSDPVLKLTPWFDCSTPPVRPGVYERRSRKSVPVLYQHWNGRVWCFYDGTPEGAASLSCESGWQRGQWRGVLR